METLASQAKEAALIPVRATQLLVRHFPALVTVIALGLAARQAVIWLAVWLSNFNALLPTLMLPLAPLSVMVSLILALWVVHPSLPFLSTTFTAQSLKPSRLQMLTIGGLLIPFLTVYVTHGLLKDDLALYRRSTTIDEYMNQGFDADFSRAFIDNVPLLVGLVVVTILIRKITGYFALGEKTAGLTTFSAYLEMLWMATVSVLITNSLSQLREWATTREVIAPSYRQYLELKSNAAEWLGPVADAWGWLTSKLPLLDDLIAVPIAWLTLGAVIYGTSLTKKKAKEAEEPANEQATESSWVKKARDTSKREVKTAVDNAVNPIVGPIKQTWNGLRTLARAGIIPMLLFCVVFMFATAIELGVVQLGRVIVGPQELLASEVAAAYILIAARAVYFIVAMCLLAVALDFFLKRTHEPEEKDQDSERNSSGSGSTTVTK